MHYVLKDVEAMEIIKDRVVSDDKGRLKGHASIADPRPIVAEWWKSENV